MPLVFPTKTVASSGARGDFDIRTIGRADNDCASGVVRQRPLKTRRVFGIGGKGVGIGRRCADGGRARDGKSWWSGHSECLERAILISAGTVEFDFPRVIRGTPDADCGIAGTPILTGSNVSAPGNDHRLVGRYEFNGHPGRGRFVCQGFFRHIGDAGDRGVPNGHQSFRSRQSLKTGCGLSRQRASRGSW